MLRTTLSRFGVLAVAGVIGCESPPARRDASRLDAPGLDAAEPELDAVGLDAPGLDAVALDVQTLPDAFTPPDAFIEPGATPRMADFWAGRARWEWVRSYTPSNTGWAGGFTAGTKMFVLGDAWYFVSRTVDPRPAPAGCGTQVLSTEIRRSMDRGVTWSAPVSMITPTTGSAIECAATDGDLFFDAAANRWHWLFQCLPARGAWAGCHATREGADPMGAFTLDAANPVIPAGSLWNRICDTAADDCSTFAGGPRRVSDEGTFDIFTSQGGFHYFAFHGYDGTRGYRGIAKTADFRTFLAGTPADAVPGDAVGDLADIRDWREDWDRRMPIGVGAGSLYEEDGVFYQLMEGADRNLGCTAGQRWDFGLFRSTSLTATTWEQYPLGNPILYSSLDPQVGGLARPCNVQYARIFRDPNTREVFMHYTREDQDPAFAGVRLMRLVFDRNILPNGDLWTCTQGGWGRMGSTTNLVVYRLPQNSSDDNCYLATNCGAASCAPGQSVYEDVALAPGTSGAFRFGGRFMSEGGPSELNMVVFQLDGAGAPLASTEVRVPLGDTYAASEGTFTLMPGARTLRFQLYLLGAPTLRADEMFIRPI